MRLWPFRRSQCEAFAPGMLHNPSEEGTLRFMTSFFWSNPSFWQISAHVDLHFLQFINYLVNQLAAHRFLKISCQLEKRAKISSAYLLLKAIELELHSYLSAVDVRLVLVADFIHYKFGILFSLLSMSSWWYCLKNTLHECLGSIPFNWSSCIWNVWRRICWWPRFFSSCCEGYS